MCASARVCLSKRTRNHVYIIQNTKTIIEIAFWNGVCKRRKRPFSFTTHRPNNALASLVIALTRSFLIKKESSFTPFVISFIQFYVDFEYKLSFFVFYYCREYFEFRSQSLSVWIFCLKETTNKPLQILTPPYPSLCTCRSLAIEWKTKKNHTKRMFFIAAFRHIENNMYICIWNKGLVTFPMCI